MHVMLYGLEPKKITPPWLTIFSDQDKEKMERALFVLQPSLLLVHETLAHEILEDFAVGKTEVIVVSPDASSQNVRRWTARGASLVWAEEEWEETLYSSKATRNESVLGNFREGTSTHYSSNRGTVLIAVGGVYGGAGSTHTALLVAQYLANVSRRKVAVWEGGNHPCFDFLRYVELGSYSDGSYFNLGGNLTLFRHETDWNWIDHTQQFRYLILDLGDLTASEEVQRLFFKAELPILIGSGSLWRMREIVQFCQINAQVRQDRWRIALPLASATAQEELAELLSGRPVFAVPSNPEVLEIRSETAEVLEGMLSPVMEKRPKKKFARLF
ncbi:hypothetical protein [Paenibacillus macerans]|uniref:Uncharacterized protein n=1 Tax=Paenibacillus macerans TaxID=44252 RepID=A0A090Y3Y5_PAEMA|nr:hypothetical protein [Paenibacillus macerans]KFM93134.1 hypothetical protein DJ90_2957 [Paenibacillus macerans]MCY7561564.1 hypothetical protein [Paenibacillus macerans]MEC0153337.1 hypothetical protein [Paenibacillus macerans]SUA84807.1 serine/threonine protein kinase [Paenibacillus macerans]